MNNIHRTIHRYMFLAQAPRRTDRGPGEVMSPKAKPKAKNTATLNDLIKVMRGNVTRLDETNFRPQA